MIAVYIFLCYWKVAIIVSPVVLVILHYFEYSLPVCATGHTHYFEYSLPVYTFLCYGKSPLILVSVILHYFECSLQLLCYWTLFLALTQLMKREPGEEAIVWCDVVISRAITPSLHFLHRSQLQFHFTEEGNCGPKGKLWESLTKEER